MTEAQEKATLFMKEFKELLEKHKVQIDLDCEYTNSDYITASIYSPGYYIAEDDHYTGYDIPISVLYSEITSETKILVDFKD